MLINVPINLFLFNKGNKKFKNLVLFDQEVRGSFGSHKNIVSKRNRQRGKANKKNNVKKVNKHSIP